MNEKKQNIIGRGNVRHDQWFTATISEKNLHFLLENLSELNGYKYVSLNINIIKDAKPDKFGKTKDVQITFSDWKPDGNRTVRDEIKEVAKSVEQNSGDMPF